VIYKSLIDEANDLVVKFNSNLQ